MEFNNSVVSMKRAYRILPVIGALTVLLSLGAPQLGFSQTPTGGTQSGTTQQSGTGNGNAALDAVPLKTLRDTINVGRDQPFPTGKQDTDVFRVANAVIRTFFILLALIFLALMLYGGWNWMTAMGDDEKVNKGKDTIIAAVIGMIILIAAYAITTFVISNIYGYSL